MSNVIFIGDLHLRSTSPIARCDDYPNVILGKLESIANVKTLYCLVMCSIHQLQHCHILQQY